MFGAPQASTSPRSLMLLKKTSTDIYCIGEPLSSLLISLNDGNVLSATFPLRHDLAEDSVGMNAI
jgi:ABC-type nitrate/sulfonate/bicarbonate transport system substrate-binding protein